MNTILPPPPSKFPTIVIVEDDAHFANSLKRKIEKDCQCQVVAVFNSGIECINQIHQCVPELLIIDFELPLLSGVDTLKQLISKGLRLPAIFITAFNFPEYVEAAAQFENTSCILKQDIGQICNAIDKLSGHVRQNIKLTEEDLHLIKFICDGFDNTSIAAHYNVSEETIKKRKQLLTKKIGIENNSSAMLKWAIKNKAYELK
jgi:two-component system, NarL family, response regulator YdfI